MLCSLSLVLNSVQAEDWSLCAVPVISPDPASDNSSFVSEITADELTSQSKDFLIFSGQVEYKRNTESINADRLELYRDPQRLQASGNILYSDDLLKLTTDTMSFNDELKQGLFENSDFQLFENHMRGSAEHVEQTDELHSQFTNVNFTTCDPGDNHWSLSASELKLNKDTRQGTASNAVLKVGPMPVFYFPWMMFPIGDQRMSGILSPTISDSKRDGTTISLPTYWNQAENYDMTITPVSYSKRSLQINTENRYLFQNNQGLLNLSYLDDDLTGEERWYKQWLHEIRGPLDIRTSIVYQKVSDEAYLKDFEQLESITYADFLKSSISFSKTIADWETKLLFEEYQTIDLTQSIASRPYRRVPRLTIERKKNQEVFSLNVNWQNELVRFDKEDSITGDRVHIKPTISYPMEGDYYFLKPSLQLDFTEYRLDNNTNYINSIQRSIPLLSIDSGLIFERDAGIDDLQTLEPRLYLLYVPYEEQADIPKFDTSLIAENYNSLFVNNRFSGADRIGDSEQISFGLTTRLLDKENGKEWFSASIAQAFYAKDREVSTGSTVDERRKSSLMTKLNYKPTEEWNLQWQSALDQELQEYPLYDFTLRRRAGQQVFNLEYHYRRNSLEQSTVSMVYPVSSQWTSYVKYQYSYLKEMPVQNLFGLQYDSCCWRFNLLYEDLSDDALTETDHSVYFQFTFKGLSNTGKDIGTILEDGILGYQSD
jgi:LPS-assembly protein